MIPFDDISATHEFKKYMTTPFEDISPAAHEFASDVILFEEALLKVLPVITASRLKNFTPKSENPEDSDDQAHEIIDFAACIAYQTVTARNLARYSFIEKKTPTPDAI
jgi:hypothetical protein